MSTLLYLSRAFVEFGPFTPAEMQGFYSRGILKDSDYIRLETSDAWLHVSEWAATLPPVKVETPAAPPAKKAAAKKTATPAAKKAPAKKAAKKKAG